MSPEARVPKFRFETGQIGHNPCRPLGGLCQATAFFDAFFTSSANSLALIGLLMK